MLGILAQLARHAADVAPVKPVSFTGSVVVIGMDTAMQRRLAGVTIRRIALSEGLEVHRIRSDGRLVSPAGVTVRYDAAVKRLLYLNTRVGWPGLPGEHDGVVVIDRASFRNP